MEVEERLVQQDETEAKRKIVTLEEKLLFGQCNDVEIPGNFKIVRIFTSSTFTDTAKERNYLMVHVYPELTKYCNSIGYQFQVVDMRWGIRDESTADHMTSEICLNEIRKCQQISTGPSFVTFLGQKYGWRPLPRMISDTEFKKILSGLSVDEERELLMKWYIVDRNNIPAYHYLQPLSTKDLSDLWWKHDSHKVADILRSVAKTVLSNEDSEKYYISVTESEIQEGLMNDVSPEKHCHWFKRTITDLDQYNEGKTAYYTDKFRKSLLSDPIAREMLEELKNTKLPSVLTDSMVTKFEVNWAEDKGIDNNMESHKIYLEQFGACFKEVLTELIDKGVEERKNNITSDALQMEIGHHMQMAKIKYQGFVGQENVLAAIHEYILSSDISMPLVIYGESGTGKTSVMAEAARRAALTYPEDAVVLRFLGTSAQSSDIESVLKSVNEQISQIDAIRRVKIDGVEAFNNEIYGDIWRRFSARLSIISPNRAWKESKIIIFLDSLDQLSNDNKPQRLEWLPKNLCPVVRVVVSTLPGKDHVYLPRMKNTHKDSQCIEVSKLNANEVNSVFDSWKMFNQRTLTSTQIAAVVDRFQQHPFPLYLKLLLDQAKTWKETTVCSGSQLTIKDCINYLFDCLEKKHGHDLVSHAFAYLCASRSGLSDSEMDDLLSLDDTVLNNVCQYWDTPIRRIPPLLWIRLKSDINEYIVSRAVNGIEVNFWFHRQFIEVSTQRYFSEPEKWFKLLAEYFSGEWSGVPKPCVKKDSTVGEARDRLVRPQPITFGVDDEGEENVNLRKIYHLPYCLIHAYEVEKFKELVLFNLEFLRCGQSSIKAFLDEARNQFQSDEEIKQFHIFYKSIGEVVSNISDLASQLFGRLSKVSKQGHYVRLFEDIEKAACCSKLKITPIYGEVFPSIVANVMPDHREKLTHLKVSKNGAKLFCLSRRNFMVYDFAKDEFLSTIVKGSSVDLIESIQNGDRVVINGILTFIVETGDFEIGPNFRLFKSLDASSCLNEKCFLRLTKNGVSAFDTRRDYLQPSRIKDDREFIGTEENASFLGKLVTSGKYFAYVNSGERLDKIFIGRVEEEVKHFKAKIIKEIDHEVAIEKEVVRKAMPAVVLTMKIKYSETVYLTLRVYFVFSQNGKKFICGFRDVGKTMTIQVYDTDTWEMQEYVFDWNSDATICSYFIAMIHDEEHFVVVLTNCLFVFNLETCKAKFSVKKHLPTSNYLLATGVNNTSKMAAVHEFKQCVYVYDLNMFVFNDVNEMMDLQDDKSVMGLLSSFNKFTAVFDSCVQVWTSKGDMIHQYNTPEGVKIIQASLVTETKLVMCERIGKTCRIISMEINEGQDTMLTLKENIDVKRGNNCQIKVVGDVYGLLTNEKWGCLIVFETATNKELLVSKVTHSFSLNVELAKVIVKAVNDRADTFNIYKLCNGRIWKTVTHQKEIRGVVMESVWCMTEKYFIYNTTDGPDVYVYNLDAEKIHDRLRLTEVRVIHDIYFTDSEQITVTTGKEIIVCNKKQQPKWKKEENWDYKSANLFFYGSSRNEAGINQGEIVFSSDRTKLIVLEKNNTVVSVYDTTKHKDKYLNCNKFLSLENTIQAIAVSSDNSIGGIIDENMIVLKITENYLILA